VAGPFAPAGRAREISLGAWRGLEHNYLLGLLGLGLFAASSLARRGGVAAPISARRDDHVRSRRLWVVLPTYNEADNVVGIAGAILAALPGSTLLVVDDGSPDGTGRLADELAAANPRVRVCHRAAKQGLGRAYLEGFRVALDGGASAVVQMDADWSHDPATLPSLVGPIAADAADLVIGSRYVAGGGVADWGLGRRIVSRAGSLFARTVLALKPHDLTGGFKAWRASTLAAIPFDGVHAGGYVFQIEMTYRASRAAARVREVPILFRDRRAGQSKMSRRIIVEALLVVLQLRWDELVASVRSRRS
jgi:dolichol-phosphate mannosyltransferase